MKAAAETATECSVLMDLPVRTGDIAYTHVIDGHEKEDTPKPPTPPVLTHAKVLNEERHTTQRCHCCHVIVQSETAMCDTEGKVGHRGGHNKELGSENERHLCEVNVAMMSFRQRIILRYM